MLNLGDFSQCLEKPWKRGEGINLSSSLHSPTSHWSATTFNVWVSFHYLVPFVVIWNTIFQPLSYGISLKLRSGDKNQKL